MYFYILFLYIIKVVWYYLFIINHIYFWNICNKLLMLLKYLKMLINFGMWEKMVVNLKELKQITPCILY